LELTKELINVIAHLDKYLNIIIQNYGVWTYLILFLLIMIETGLVVVPFLPGDSLLFASGAFAAIGSLNILWLFLILYSAAIIGDTINYHIGKSVGPKIFQKDNIKFLKKEHLLKTQAFYERYGGKTIIIARFMPIIRTFAPFVAGIGEMKYSRFLFFNMIGGLLWVFSLTLGGYFFGNIPIVKNNFTTVIYLIIFISILPGLISIIKYKFKKEEKTEKKDEQTESKIS
jgi:membrane-associated protein